MSFENNIFFRINIYKESKGDILEKDIKEYKGNAIRHLLIIKMINEKTKKLNLDKSMINSVLELMDQNSLNKHILIKEDISVK